MQRYLIDGAADFIVFDVAYGTQTVYPKGTMYLYDWALKTMGAMCVGGYITGGDDVKTLTLKNGHTITITKQTDNRTYQVRFAMPEENWSIQIPAQWSGGNGAPSRVLVHVSYQSYISGGGTIGNNVKYYGTENDNLIFAPYIPYSVVINNLVNTLVHNNLPLQAVLNNLFLSDNLNLVSLEYFFSGQPTWKGDTSEEGGGDGDFTMDSDAIDFPPKPASALNIGLITAYDVTRSELRQLAKFLWSDLFTEATIKKLFNDPMEAIIGLYFLPLVMDDWEQPYNIVIGPIDTEISSHVVRSQYVRYNLGTLTVPKYYGNAIDYSPYTRVSIYLPYIGTQQLDIDDIAGKTLQLVYSVDILTGSLTAMLKAGDSVMYQYVGNCLMPIPLTAGNMANAFGSLLQLVGDTAVTVATGGASAPVTLPDAAAAVAGMKPNITKASPTGSTSGYLGVQQPYLIYEFPNQSLPVNYNKFCGYPSNITAKLGDLSGYTQVERVHLENIVAEPSELSEIERLLQEGVII